MATKREQIVATTCNLMETQGYHATGLNQILTESGAPKGSLYYYFPGGKEELALEAVECTSRAIALRIETQLAAHADPVAAIENMLHDLAIHVEASGYAAGAPITAIALEAASTHEQLRMACHEAYTRWQEVIAAKLTSSGVDETRAAQVAILILAAIEGAITLCRCQRSVAPLHAVAAEVKHLLHTTR